MRREAQTRWAIGGTAVLSSLAGVAGTALAHGVGQRYDLPVPLWLYAVGAAATVVVSFAVVGLFVQESSAPRPARRFNLLRSPLARALAHPGVCFGVRVLSVILFISLIVAGLAGRQALLQNLAPTLVWVVWWVGVAYACAFVGNVWALINPWAILFAWGEALYRRCTGGRELSRNLPYPRALQVWPGLLLFLAFTWVELVFEDAAIPSKLAGFVLLYSGITWAGMFCFGRAVWLRYGEAFSLVFSLLARFSPTEVRVIDAHVCQTCPLDCRDQHGDCVNCYACFSRAEPAQREWNLRPYAAGLLRHERISVSEMVLVVVLLAAVAFDSFMATSLWVGIEIALQTYLPDLGPMRLPLIRTFGLLVVMLLFLEIYLLFSALMARVSGKRFPVVTFASAFVFSLVPIAIAYHIAHYLSFLLVQGQYIVPLLSDPLGWGWNLFGTAAYRVNFAIVGARFGWYAAVIPIVVGPIIAVYIAYVVALRTLRDPVLALRSQFPMLALMVGYTLISLWILTQPMIQGREGEMAGTPEAPVAANQTPEQLHQRLAAIAPLQADSSNPSMWSMEPDVKSGVLCYCLHKAPDTIRALRQLGDRQFAQGLAALREQRYDEAIAALSRAIQLNPRDVRAYVNRGLAYGHMRAYAQAHDDFTRALDWAPRQAEASYARQITERLLERVAQAR